MKPWHVLIALNAALGAGLVWSSAQSQGTPRVFDVLQARSIELVNDAGLVVAQLYLGVDGSGQLRMRNASGEVRVKLGVSNDGNGAGLLLMDRRTEPAVMLTSADRPSLQLTTIGSPAVTVGP